MTDKSPGRGNPVYVFRGVVFCFFALFFISPAPVERLGHDRMHFCKILPQPSPACHLIYDERDAFRMHKLIAVCLAAVFPSECDKCHLVHYRLLAVQQLGGSGLSKDVIDL